MKNYIINKNITTMSDQTSERLRQIKNRLEVQFGSGTPFIEGNEVKISVKSIDEVDIFMLNRLNDIIPSKILVKHSATGLIIIVRTK